MGRYLLRRQLLGKLKRIHMGRKVRGLSRHLALHGREGRRRGQMLLWRQHAQIGILLIRKR